ncbi:hypothetical protein CLV98_102167 [Dyadobacter jejuensis]|uniref:Secreted protein (Por secretion system target) n=1 Tax=Dyadobacter jejuensis TaxID=1082580 RepID=A0A316AQA7_9BACT|nr:hypothetical protein [Dyadobacter jejuensis]PWJ59334.1 hypothetical protein CLV98_102167 [Dyadobacter jejuensis]
MKKLIFSLALLIGLSVSSFSFASEKNENAAAKVELATMGGLKFKLSLSSVSEKSSMAIKDNFGEVLYRTNLPKSDNYSKIFDFSTLNDGNYIFVINNGGEIVEKPITIETHTTRTATPAEL